MKERFVSGNERATGVEKVENSAWRKQIVVVEMKINGREINFAQMPKGNSLVQRSGDFIR